ncbi:hypothetical protein V2J85_41035, partial [Streptomyces sp. DSM 41528]|nr:hypothetical protein [Streptomyces sp. DSM 41528]
RQVGSVGVRGPQMGWPLLQGAFGLLLGLLVLFDWPHSSLYVLGVFFSLALLFDGLGLIAIGIGGRRIEAPAAGTRASFPRRVIRKARRTLLSALRAPRAHRV